MSDGLSDTNALLKQARHQCHVNERISDGGGGSVSPGDSRGSAGLLPVLVRPSSPHPQGHQRAGRQSGESRRREDRHQAEPVRRPQSPEEAGQLGAGGKEPGPGRHQRLRNFPRGPDPGAGHQVLSAAAQNREGIRHVQVRPESEADLPPQTRIHRRAPDRRDGRDGRGALPRTTLRTITQTPGQNPQALPHLRTDHRRPNSTPPPQCLPRLRNFSPRSARPPTALNCPKSGNSS